MFRCASYALLCLALGDPSDWPASATDAWSAVPERVFFDERSAFRGGPLRAVRAASVSGDPRIACVVRSAGPRELLDPVLASDPPAGHLVVTFDGASRELPVGMQALTEGILLGRYDRCQSSELLAPLEVSRVHALVVQVRDRLLVIDTASTNGLFVDGQAVRVAELREGATFAMGMSARARVGWRVP